MTSTVVGDYLYINGKIRNKLLKYSLTDNEVAARLEYDKFKELPENGDPFQGGLVQYDPYSDTIFLGYYRKPFRLEQYDKDLNLINTYTSDSFDDFSPCEWCLTRSNTISQ